MSETNIVSQHGIRLHILNYLNERKKRFFFSFKLNELSSLYFIYFVQQKLYIMKIDEMLRKNFGKDKNNL